MRLVPLPMRTLQCGPLKLDLSEPNIMGILNVTPDSFSDGGQYLNPVHAVEHALQMMADGATIIDIGGESTRPGAAFVGVEEEIRRVIPVVQALSEYEVVLSIDSSEPQLIREAVRAGAHIWNDVRGLTRPGALQTAAELAIPVIIMHMRGEPATMNDFAQYDDVSREVMQELQQRVDAALSAGIHAENIIIDPGFGFAKNTRQNLELLQELYRLDAMGYPLLSGLSRKRFIGEVLQGADAQHRAVGSVAGHLLSIQQGASIIRTHDVKAMHDAISIWRAMIQA
ncbi:dihydropteroate synthase [Acinetobacter sp. WZC-1]|uniref:dihydropteroate synthase n=1 Tax=Acinetobacter sp. WZC-1 TaxID=3459034 RepID=UPI00403D6882